MFSSVMSSQAGNEKRLSAKVKKSHHGQAFFTFPAQKTLYLRTCLSYMYTISLTSGFSRKILTLPRNIDSLNTSEPPFFKSSSAYLLTVLIDWYPFQYWWYRVLGTAVLWLQAQGLYNLLHKPFALAGGGVKCYFNLHYSSVIFIWHTL